jgi:hypothetical protein
MLFTTTGRAMYVPWQTLIMSPRTLHTGISSPIPEPRELRVIREQMEPRDLRVIREQMELREPRAIPDPRARRAIREMSAA